MTNRMLLTIVFVIVVIIVLIVSALPPMLAKAKQLVSMSSHSFAVVQRDGWSPIELII